MKTTSWINNPIDTHYIVGSVVGPHPFPDMVARFQSVISKEIKEQLLLAEGRNYPDYLIACVGGGSNAAGTFYDYLDDERVKIICVEASGKGVNSGKSAATTKLGKTGIIHGSKTLLMQTDDGQITEPYSISAGLDYPGIGPMHANLFTSGRGEFISIDDDEAMSAGLQLSQLEGIIPAIETSHALAVFDHKKFNSTDIIVLNLSGRGDKDLENYINYLENVKNYSDHTTTAYKNDLEQYFDYLKNTKKNLEKLNNLGAKNGVGRIDIVENRYIGMKSRGCYETPGGTIILMARRALEGITVDKELLHMKQELMPKYAKLIYNGYWWSPERNALQGLINESQNKVSGHVKLRLIKGNVIILGRKSINSLYDNSLVSFDEVGGYNQKDAEGFIKLNALRLRTAAKKGRSLRK